MPQCIVYVYDHTLTSVSTSLVIEITETDHFGVKLDMQPGRTLGPGEFGAPITLPSPPKAIKVWVDETSRLLAPTVLGHLNGKMTSRLDVILYPVPRTSGKRGGGGGGGGVHWQASPDPYMSDRNYGIYQPLEPAYNQEPVQSPMMIAAYINHQVRSGNWKELEALGVRSLVETVTHALNTPRLNSSLTVSLERWQAQLDVLGINISAQTGQRKENEGENEGGLVEA